MSLGKGVVGNGIIPFCNLEDSALSRKAPRVGALHTELVSTFHSAELVHHIPQFTGSLIREGARFASRLFFHSTIATNLRWDVLKDV